MERIASKNLRTLLVYWRGKGARPSRSDIDATEIPQLLKNILIVDVERAPLRFRYSLVGTLVTQVVGRDVTGHLVDEALYGDTAAFVHSAYKQVVDAEAPLLGRGRVVFADGAAVPTEIVMAPLFAEGGVDKLLLGLDFPSRPAFGPDRTVSAFQVVSEPLIRLTIAP